MTAPLTAIVQPTGHFAEVNGVRCRCWEGATSDHQHIILYVALVAAPAGGDQAAFEAALQPAKPASAALASFDTRLIIP